MTRDDIILSCIPVVDNLVRKYNNHHSDEDLQSIGMIAVVECVDRSLKEGMTDINQIQARCNTWARNAILDDVYKEKVRFSPDTTAIEHMEAKDDLYEVIYNTKKILTDKQNEVFDLLMQGCDAHQIANRLHISKHTAGHHMKSIKDKIRSLKNETSIT